MQIRGAVAEYERTLITERMRRGRRRKLEAGLMLPWTRAPFGYRVDPDRPRDPAGVRIEEAEAAIVREMFAWHADEAHSFCSLARLLERRGIRTSTGLARWNLASIRGLLTNPAYAGRQVLRHPLASPRHAGAAFGDGAAKAVRHEPGGRAARRVDPGGRDPAPCQPGAVRPRAGAARQQPALRAAQQQGPPLPAEGPAEGPGQLRRVRP